mgnify:CR=1 FL=1
MNTPSNTRAGTFALAVAAFVSAVSALMFNAMPLYLGAAADNLGLNNREMGYLASSFFSGYTLATFTALLWIYRFNWRYLSAAMGVIASVGFVVAALVDTQGLLLSILFSLGVCSGVLFTLALTLLGSGAHPEKCYALGQLTQIGLGATVALCFPALITRQWGYAGVTCGFALLFLLAACCAKGMPATAPQKLPHCDASCASNRKPVLESFALFLFLLGHSGLWAFIERVGDSAGFTTEFVGLSMSVGLLSGAAAGVIPLLLGDRFGHARPLSLAMLIYLAALWSVYLFEGQAAYVIGIMLSQAALAIYFVYQWAQIAVNDGSGRVTPMIPAVMGLGIAIGPGVAGLLAGSGYLPLFILLTVTTLASLLALLEAVRRRRASEDSSAALLSAG